LGEKPGGRTINVALLFESLTPADRRSEGKKTRNRGKETRGEGEMDGKKKMLFWRKTKPMPKGTVEGTGDTGKKSHCLPKYHKTLFHSTYGERKIH